MRLSLFRSLNKTRLLSSSTKPRLIPPIEVIKSLSEKSKQLLPRIIAELEVLSELKTTVPSSLELSEWLHLASLQTLSDRERYFVSLCDKTVTNDEVQTEKTLLPFIFQGKTFRNLIDKTYGGKMWMKQRLEEDWPEIRLDCSLLYSLTPINLAGSLSDVQNLIEANWANNYPLVINLNNYTPDGRISALARQKWHFLYGPQSENLESFQPHVMGPTVSSRTVSSTLPEGIRPDQVTVIDSRAREVLTYNDLENTKVFVVNAYSEDRIPPDVQKQSTFRSVRFPFEEHVKWKRGKKAQRASVNVAILRDLLERKMDFKEAFIKNLPLKHLTDKPISEDEAETVMRDLRLEIIETSGHQINLQRNPRIPRQELTDRPKKRIHRYSREERNRRRSMENNQKTKFDLV